MIKENCGLIGICGHPEASRMAYFGLYALQHRGQESAGIVSWDGKKLREQKGMGLVGDIFKERHLGHELKGDTAIGHIRYSTTGASLLRNAQPFLVHFRDKDMAIGHNGNLTNSVQLKRELEAEGSIFQTGMDSEVILHLIAKNSEGLILEEAIAKAVYRIRGAYCLLILANEKMIAIRDPWGFRPLVLGKKDGTYIFASETCALDLLEAEYIREVEQGEMITVEQGELKSTRIQKPTDRKACIFELIYFARPDSKVFSEIVYDKRKEMGRRLAKEFKISADYCMPFPDSGVYAAVGYSQESGLPFENTMIRNHYVGRTFIQPSQEMRDFGVRVKLNPVKEMIKDNRIVIIEDSIVRGTTIKTRIRKLREIGAKQIHLVVSCPPIKFPCYYGIDFSSKGELIAATQTVKEIKEFIGLDSLHYLSIEGLLKAVNAQEGYCLSCFQGDYPLLPDEGYGKMCLEA